MSGVCDAQDHHHHPEMKCQYEADHCFICFPVCYIFLDFRFDLWASKSNANVLNLWFTGICKMTKAFDL